MLALGLLLRPRAIAARAGTYLGFNPEIAVGTVRGKFEGAYGLLLLGFGFAMQVAGYIVGFLHPAASGQGTARALTAGVVTAVVLAALLAPFPLIKDRWMKRELVRASRFHHDEPSRFLVACGVRTGEPLDDGEEAASYVKRVFGVDADSLDARWRASRAP